MSGRLRRSSSNKEIKRFARRREGDVGDLFSHQQKGREIGLGEEQEGDGRFRCVHEGGGGINYLREKGESVGLQGNVVSYTGKEYWRLACFLVWTEVRRETAEENSTGRIL